MDAKTAATLDEPMTNSEIISAIKNIQNGKSPGPDGFTIEFYKKFGELLSPIMLDMYQESFLSGILPQTMRRATISLISKKDKNPIKCGSYRPISLLNVDNKILSKTIAQRLETVMPKIISEDQTGFIKNQQLSSNIRRLLNILYNPNPPDNTEVVIAFNAEKTFDRVEWDYLFHTLGHFGFGKNFITWIRVIYSQPLAAVCTNNNISEYFHLQRGTRQGCPLSPLLSIEPLAIAICSDVEIRGVLRDGIENKILYADDILLYLTDPETTLPKALDLINYYGKISGYKINLQKNEFMPIGTAPQLASLNMLPLPIKMSQ